MININGEEWRIALVSPFDPVLRRSDKSYTIGVCDDILKTIFINKELNQEYVEKVLCHELTHAAMFSYNIDLTLEQEEILADLIATYGQEIVHITNLVFKRIIEKRGRL
jgi:hypothetical protein